MTDAGTSPGVSVVRSLGRAGWNVVALDTRRLSPAFVSRFAGERHLGPLPELNGALAAQELVELAHRHRPELVFPTTDQSLFPLLARVGDLPAGTVVAAACPSALAVAQDKERTLTLAGDVGVPAPRRQVVGDLEDLMAAGDDLGWPVICKPLMSHEPRADGSIATRQVTFARSREELRELWESRSIAAPLMVQQYVTGVGIGVDLLCRDGVPIAAFQHRRLREVPIWGGMSAARVSEPVNPQLLRLARQMLEPLCWTGLAMVEFRETPDGPMLMEINGRIWGSVALPIHAGLDFPALAAELHMTGREPTSAEVQYRTGIQCRNFELELRWVFQALRHRTAPDGRDLDIRPLGALGVLLSLLRPTNKFDFQSWSDPGPGVVDAFGAIGRLAREVPGRSAGRLRRGR